MSTYYYYANPTIYVLPRGKKYLFEEEEQTVDGKKEIIKKCEINEILSTFMDSSSNDFVLSNKKFKEIESRIYLDLWKDYSNNKFTVSKKCCIGFFKYKDSQNNFMDKEAKFNCIEIICENTENPQLNVYLSSGNDNNKDDPSQSIVLNLNYEENCVKEFNICVEYQDNVVLPVKDKIKLKARFYGQKEWKKEISFTLYRNTQNTLDSFKLVNNQNIDFFVVPKTSISNNQAQCIKQLEIINNQVFSRNKKFTSFKFVRENGFFEDENKTFEEKSYENLINNIKNSITFFKSDSNDSTKGCRSGNKIGDLTTNYNYNFNNYGPKEELLDYLEDNYSFTGKEKLLGRVLDCNFLFGKTQYEGIVNLYRNVVIPFIDSTIQEALRYVNFPNRWFSCPKFNPNYQRGAFTTTNNSKKLYSSINNDNGAPITEYFLNYLTNYSGSNNCLPVGTVVTFAKGSDAYAYDLTESTHHCYKISSIKFPNNEVENISIPLWIPLNLADKQSCDDSAYDENYSDYDSTGIYTNNGVPYYISEGGKSGGKHTYFDFLSMTASSNNWYSYNKYPSMYDSEGLGLDCSGLVINAVCDCNNSNHKLTITDGIRKNGISVKVVKSNLVRAIDMKIYDSDNSLMQKGDFVLSEIRISANDWARHITICSSGSINDNFMNTNITKNSLATADFEVIHNYGATDSADENYIYKNLSENNTADRIKSGCYMKTLQGPYKNTGIKVINDSNTNVIIIEDVKKITIGRIFLWN